MAIELLQHALERFGVVTVMDATLYEVGTNKPVMFLDTLKISNISSETQEKQIKGGRYADLLVVYNFDRTVNLEFQDALLSFSSMKNLWGAELDRTAANIVEHTKYTGVVATAAIALPQAALAIGGVFDATANVELTLGTATPAAGRYYWIDTDADAIKFNAAQEGHNMVVYYTVAATDTGFDPVQALIKSSSFPTTVKFVGQTFFIEEATGKQILAEIEIPKLKLNSNFTLTMESEGDASVFDFSGMALVENTTTRDLIKLKALRYLD